LPQLRTYTIRQIYSLAVLAAERERKELVSFAITVRLAVWGDEEAMTEFIGE